MTTQRTYAGADPGMFEELFDASMVGMAFLDGGNRSVRRANAAFEALIGPGEGPPEAMIADLCQAVGGRTIPEIRKVTRAGEGGQVMVLRITALPLPGQAETLACFVEDISHESETAAPELLLMEAQHRIRNCLAVLRAIFQRTVHHSSGADELAAHFLGRLDAFARVQSNLLVHDRHGFGLYELVLDELALQGSGAQARVGISGPEIRLHAKPAETFSLAIHELAVNSVKFGVLGTGAGSIDVLWDVAAGGKGQMLTFIWNEETDEYIPHPLHRGFGMEMLTQTAAFELGAEVDIGFRNAGLRWAMTVPVTDWLLFPHCDEGNPGEGL